MSNARREWLESKGRILGKHIMSFRIDSEADPSDDSTMLLLMSISTVRIQTTQIPIIPSDT